MLVAILMVWSVISVLAGLALGRIAAANGVSDDLAVEAPGGRVSGDAGVERRRTA